MDLVIRGLVIYAVVFVLMRAAGSRQFSEMTAFDAVLVIIIAEVTGQALSGDDYSLTGAIVVLATIIGADILVSLAKHRWKGFERAVDGVPALLMRDGKLVHRTMDKERVEEGDILGAARQQHGMESLDHVKFAVLEPSGEITIIPKGKGHG